MKKAVVSLALIASFVMAAPAMADHLANLKKTDVMGSVSAMDPGKSLTVKTDKGEEKVIMLDPETKVMGKDGKDAKADAIVKDSKVKVSAAEVDGKWVAATVAIQ